MKDDLDKAQQRARQYWHVDGLLECAFCVLCLLLGIYFYAQATLPPESLAYKILNVSLIIVIIGGSFLVNRVLVIAKERITYPRTGYVAYRQASGARRWVRVIVAAGVSMLIATLITQLIIRGNIDLAWMPVITGAVFGFVMLLVAFRANLIRFYTLSLISVLIGCGFLIVRIDNILGLAIYYILFGLAIGLSGGLTLWSYLRQAPPPAEESDER
ncbi:MAG: hypothetical protein JW726_13100 [Anaerolineales bacterium]|nr:hypothetical protein [Anaerolineales bacterium]